MKEKAECVIEGEKKPTHVRCPYLSTHSNKFCERMVREGLDGDLSEFDIQNFCEGDPVRCYFFRFPPSKNKWSLFSTSK